MVRSRRKVLAILVVWDLLWRLLAVYRALRNRQFKWAVALAVVNSAGILPMLYLFRWSRPADRG